MAEERASGRKGHEGPARRRRADARRNVDALLEAAKTVFASSGVQAPAKEITDLAGVGVGTLYRHFPQRSDLVTAVLKHEIDAIADSAAELSSANAPTAALDRWLQQYAALITTKQGLASALHSDDPSFGGLHDHFMRRVGPAFASLFEAAKARGEVRADIGSKDVLYAVAKLCQPAPGEEAGFNERMVALLVDGLRHTGSSTASRQESHTPPTSGA